MDTLVINTFVTYLLFVYFSCLFLSLLLVLSIRAEPISILIVRSVSCAARWRTHPSGLVT